MQVGRFKLQVSEPYPVWITITDGRDSHDIRLSHRELRDLEYAIAWAIRQAQNKLRSPSSDLSVEV